jgi:DNA (cytosine-5)-methyltransferase 1
MVSVLDETARYEFPDPMPLTIRLKDVLEKEVEERYYLSDQQIEAFNLESMSLHKGLSGKVYETDGSSPTITAGEGVKYNTKILQRGHGYNKGGEFEDVAPTITTSSYENNNHVAEPIRRRDKIRYKQMENGNIRAYRDDDKKSGASELQIIHPENVACTVTTAHEPKIIETTHRIRKLTERECFRLMDVPEEYIDRLMSDTGFIVYDGKKYVQVPRLARSRLYKMAGNSIVVACMYHIWRKLFIDTEIKTLTLF